MRLAPIHPDILVDKNEECDDVADSRDQSVKKERKIRQWKYLDIKELHLLTRRTRRYICRFAIPVRPK